MQRPALCFIREAMVTSLPSCSWHSPLEPDVVIRHCPATRSRRGHWAGPVKLRSSLRRGSSRCAARRIVFFASPCCLVRVRVRQGPCRSPTIHSGGSGAPSPGLVPRVCVLAGCRLLLSRGFLPRQRRLSIVQFCGGEVLLKSKPEGSLLC